MLQNLSFKFYQLPDLQRSIDIMLGILGTFVVQCLWNHRLTVRKYLFLTGIFVAIFVPIPYVGGKLVRLADDPEIRKIVKNFQET